MACALLLRAVFWMFPFFTGVAYADGLPNAWRIRSNPQASGASLIYATNLTALQHTSATNSGWHYDMNARLVDDGGTAATLTFSYSDGVSRFAASLFFDANTNLMVRLAAPTPIVQTLTINGMTASKYHTHELVYDPVPRTATYRFDGKSIVSWAGELKTSNPGRVGWGVEVSSGSGQANVHQVGFHSGPESVGPSYDAGTEKNPIIALDPAANAWIPFPPGSGNAFETGPVSPDTPVTVFDDIHAVLPDLGGPVVGWGDYNNDGFLDIMITGTDRSSLLGIANLFNNISGYGFESKPSALLGLYPSNPMHWETGDYDNDGQLDVLFNRVVRHTFGASFTTVSKTLLPGPAVWADYNNDGYLDAFNADSFHPTLPGRLYRSLAGGRLILQTVTNLPGPELSNSAWGDYDNDGYPDLLITGNTFPQQFICDIYHNEGGTNFVIAFSLQGIFLGAAVWGDYDNDGYLDILLGGATADGHEVTRVYHNDQGQGFTLRASLPPSTAPGSLAWGDFDGDGLLDIALSGGTNGFATHIYRNLGAGNFELQQSVELPSIGSVAWGDFDNDGDLDLVLSGHVDSGGGHIAAVFRNNSPVLNLPPSAPGGLNARVHGTSVLMSWNLASDDHTPPKGLTYALAMGSGSNGVDRFSPLSDLATGRRRVAAMGAQFHARTVQVNDLQPDVIYHWSVQAIDNSFAGGTFAEFQTFKIPGVTCPRDILTNTSPGECSRTVSFAASPSLDVASTPICQIGTNLIESPYTFPVGTNIVTCSVSNAWGDNSCSFKVTVRDDEPPRIECPTPIVAYAPPGSNFVVVTYRVSTADNCGVVSTDFNPPSGHFFPIGTNVVVCRAVDAANNLTTCSFTITVIGVPLFSAIDSGIIGLSDGAGALADFDGDGWMDLLISGVSRNLLGRTTRLYRNEGNDTFTAMLLPWPALESGSLAWADMDLDGDLDVVITGLGSSGPVATIFRNDGKGVFTELRTKLVGVYDSAVAWGDYDNDGWPDLLITGTPDGVNPLTRLYRNCRDGTFADVHVELPDVVAGAIAWGDYDLDGTLDLVLVGFDGDQDITQIYRGLGAPYGGPPTFVRIGDGLEGVENGAVAWGDFDGDGRPDLIVTGLSVEGPWTALYRNGKHDLFTRVNSALLPQLHNSAAAWGDFDNDGHLDLLLAGNVGLPTSARVTRVYRNNGDGTFKDANAGLVAVDRGIVAWADYNRDGRLDLLIAGYTGSNRVSQMYRSNVPVTNTSPSAPSGLTASLTTNGVTLKWSRPIDGQTPQLQLSYNLRISGPTGMPFVVSPAADPEGSRRIPAQGNAGITDRWSLGQLALPTGTYQWAVQAVDGVFAGSAFSTNGTFYIQQPQINSLGFLEDGGFEIRFTGSNLTYRVEGTVELDCTVPWSPLGVATQKKWSEYQFIDPSIPTNRIRYYRLVFP